MAGLVIYPIKWGVKYLFYQLPALVGVSTLRRGWCPHSSPWLVSPPTILKKRIILNMLS